MGTVAFNQGLTTTSAGASNGQQQGTNNGYSPFGHGIMQVEGMQIGGQSGGYN